jgi:aminoglycoside 3-N-acetyltransferase I
MDYEYKQLGPSDTAYLRQLLSVFGSAFGDAHTYDASVPSDEYIRSLLGKAHIIVLAALHGAAVVGGLVAYLLEKFELQRKEIYAYDLAVHEDHRRRGIARHLLQLLRRVASERGAYVVYIQADLEDTPAVRLYESLGRKETVHHFDISV